MTSTTISWKSKDGLSNGTFSIGEPKEKAIESFKDITDNMNEIISVEES